MYKQIVQLIHSFKEGTSFLVDFNLYFIHNWTAYVFYKKPQFSLLSCYLVLITLSITVKLLASIKHLLLIEGKHVNVWRHICFKSWTPAGSLLLWESEYLRLPLHITLSVQYKYYILLQLPFKALVILGGSSFLYLKVLYHLFTSRCRPKCNYIININNFL